MNAQSKYDYIILHVEDMQQVRIEMKKDLINMGFPCEKIYQVEDILSFIKVVKNLRPDLIICDWNLPDGTGFDLLKKIKTINNLRDIPFVLCTTMDEITNILEAVSAGASEYVVKPWNVNELEKKLKFVLRVK